MVETPRIIRIVVVDTVGIEVHGHPITDISKLSPDQLMALSYHDPKPFRIDLASLTDEQRVVMGANRAVLQIYGGRDSFDPTLKERLSKISVPTLVIWDNSDGIADPEYGRAFAAAIPRAKFKLLKNSGHVPQIETPEQLLDALWD